MMMVEFELALAKIIIAVLLIIIALLVFVVFALNKQISDLINKRLAECKDDEKNVVK